MIPTDTHTQRRSSRPARKFGVLAKLSRARERSVHAPLRRHRRARTLSTTAPGHAPPRRLVTRPGSHAPPTSFGPARTNEPASRRPPGSLQDDSSLSRSSGPIARHRCERDRNEETGAKPPATQAGPQMLRAGAHPSAGAPGTGASPVSHPNPALLPLLPPVRRTTATREPHRVR